MAHIEVPVGHTNHHVTIAHLGDVDSEKMLMLAGSLQTVMWHNVYSRWLHFGERAKFGKLCEASIPSL